MSLEVGNVELARRNMLGPTERFCLTRLQTDCDQILTFEELLLLAKCITSCCFASPFP